MWDTEIEENFKFGLIDILILKLLSIEDMYGYQIMQTIYTYSEELSVFNYNHHLFIYLLHSSLNCF